MKVFLSHSGADKALARRLATDLTNAHVNVWLDEWEVRVGDAFEQTIERGLDEVEFVIVLLTKASVASEWVSREWRTKVQKEISTKRVAVLPVRGESCEVPDFLAQRTQTDISGGSYPLGFRHLLTILRHYSNESTIGIPAGAVERPELPDTLIPIVAPIGLEVGRDLIPYFEPDQDGGNRAVDDLAPGMRDSLRAELGFPFPGVRIRGNETDMPPRAAMILIDEIPEVWFAEIPETADPPAWLFEELRHVLRRTASSFVDLDVASRLVESIQDVPPALAAVVPDKVPWFALADILQRLVDEGVSIERIDRILEALATVSVHELDTVMLTERVRHALRQQITATLIAGRPSLPVLLVHPEIEQIVSDGIARAETGGYLHLPPGQAGDIAAAIRAAVMGSGDRAMGTPVLVHDPEVRPFVRKLASLEVAGVVVVSKHDLDPDVPMHSIGEIRLAEPDRGSSAGDPAR